MHNPTPPPDAGLWLDDRLSAELAALIRQGLASGVFTSTDADRLTAQVTELATRGRG